MSEFEAESIGPLLDAVVGSTSANGDTYLDDESMENLKKLEAVVEWVCDRINPSFDGSYPSQCASAEQVANAVRNIAYPILDFMNIDLQEVTSIARRMKEVSTSSDHDTKKIDACKIEDFANEILEAVGESCEQ